MTENRELDAIVAENVFGWKDIAESPINGAICGTNPDGERGYKYEVPRYSTRIEDAWMVVEKVRELGFPFVLESRGDMNAPGRWWAYFEKTIGDRSINGYSHEASRAICLAALKAVGKGEP